MQASMSDFVQLLEGRDDSVHQSTGNEELMEPGSPTGPEDSRALSKQLDDSNKLPPPSDIDELVFGFLGLSEAQQNTAATSLCLVRDVVPSDRSAFKPSEPKTYLIDGTSESYGGNWDEGLLENDYDYSCLSSCAHEVVITTEMQSSGTGDKDTADRSVANANEYSLDVLTQEKLDVQDFQVEEALHMASAPNGMCKRGIDPLQEDSTFFEDMGFDMRNSSEINAEGSSEDVSPACSNLHIVPMSDGMMEVSSSPPEEFAVPLSRDSGVEIGKAASPDVAKVPVSAGVGQSSQTCQAVASTSQRPVIDLTSCCGPIGAVVKNQIVLPYSGDTILSESDSLDSQDFGMPKLVRADDPPQPAADHVYDTPPELEPVDQSSSAANKKGVKTTTSTLASAAGEDLLKASKKITLGVVPETIQEATSQEELNDSLGKIVPSFTPDMSNQMPAYMNDIYDVGNISLDATCCTPTTNADGGSSLPLLPCTEEPKVYKTFDKTPPKKTKAPVVKTKDSCGVDKGFIRDLLRSVNGGPNKLSGPNCVVEFTNAKPIIRKKVFAESSDTQKKQMDSTRSGNVMDTSLLNTFSITTTKNMCPASGKPKNIPVVVKASSLELDFKSLPDLPTLLDIGDLQLTDTVPSNFRAREGNPVISTPPKRLSSSENLSGSRGKLVSNHSNKAGSIIQISKKTKTPSNPPGVDVPSNPSPIFLNKTTTIIANVAQDVVYGTKVPQIDEIKPKKSVPMETQDKPLACTSVKALTPPQELKVSLPISSLDLSSVKIVGVGPKENANVTTGTPTMAQRKQYVEVDDTPLAVAPTKRTTKNVPVISNNNAVSDVILPNKTLDGFSKSKVLSKDVTGVLNEFTVCSEALKNTLNSGNKNSDSQSERLHNDMVLEELMSTENVTMTDGAKAAKGLKHVDNNTKNISIEINEPTEITDTSKPICRLSSGQSIENISSQIEDTVGAPKKSDSSSKRPTGPLGSDEVEQTEVLKEHPVIAIVNSLIQSASKLPDSFEETPEQLEGSTDVVASDKKNTAISKDVTVKEKLSTSEVVDKLEAKSRSSVANQTHKPSLDVAPERKTTEEKVKATVPRDAVEKDQTSKLDKEKTNTCSSEIIVEKFDTFTSRKLAAQALNEVVIKEPDQASNNADKQKTQSPQEVTDKQKLVTPKIVEKRKTRLSQDSTKRTVDAALLDDAKNRKSEVQESEACLPDVELGKNVLHDVDVKQKTISLSDSLDKQKKSTTESSSAVNPVLADPNQKRKTPVTQDKVNKSKTALSEVLSARTKLALSQVVVVETKPATLETAVARSKRAKDQAKPSPSQKEVGQKKSPPVVVDKPKAMPKSVLNNTKNVIPKPVVEATKITVPQDVNSLKPLEKASTQTTPELVENKKSSNAEDGDQERKPAVDKLKPSPSKVGAKVSKTTSSLGKATKSNGEVSDIVEKGSTQNRREESLENKGIKLERVVTEKKPVLDKAKAVLSNVAVDKTKTPVPEKHKRKVEVSVVLENSNISSDAEVKNKCVSMTELGKTGKICKTETLSQFGTEFKETAEEVQKGGVQSAQEVVETGKRLCVRGKGDERRSVVESSVISLSKVLADTPLKASPSDVAEQPIESVQNILVKDNTQTLEEVVVLKKGPHAKQGEDKKHVDDKLKMKSSKVVVDGAKTSILRDVVDKLREKVESTLLNKTTPTSLKVTEKKTSAQSGEVDVEKKAVEDKPKSVGSRAVMDIMKGNEPRQVTEKPLEKIQDITKEVSTKALSDDVEKNRTMILPQPTKVANKRKSAPKEIDQKQVTTSLEDLVQKSVVLTSPGGVDGQKLSTEGNTNVMELKKSKSSDILIGVVKTRTTKMVNEACKLSSESVNSKRDSLKDKAKKPSLGHWRIVKHDKETTGVENSSVSQPEKIGKVTQEVEEESKTRLRKRGEVPPARKPSIETNLGKSFESVPAAGLKEEQGKLSAGVPKPAVSLEEEQGKLTAGAAKSALSLEEEQGKLKAGAPKSAVSLEEEQGKLKAGAPKSAVSLEEEQGKLEAGAPKSAVSLEEEQGKLTAGAAKSAVSLEEEQGKLKAGAPKSAVSLEEEQGKLKAGAPKSAVSLEEEQGKLKAGAPKSAVSLEEEQGKLKAGAPKSAVSLEEQGKLKAGAPKSAVSLEEEQRKLTVETKTKDENKTRLRTRSETSNERKMNDDGTSPAVGSDKQVIANLPKQVVISNRNTTKQTTESVDTSGSNKTSVRQIRKTSVDRKPLAQPTVPETVVEDHKPRSKSRSETPNDKKVQENKSPAEQMSKNGSKESNGNVGVLPITGQNVDESAVSEDVICIDGKSSSATAVMDQVHEETKNRLRTRSETSCEKKVDNSLPVGTEDQVGLSESLAKRVVPLDKNVSKTTKDMTNVQLKSPPHEGNKLRQTRSDTSIEKKLKKAETSSPLTNQPLNTEPIPKSNLVGKPSVNDVYDFTEDEVQSNIRTIDQFRTMSGKSMKNKRTLSVSGALESSVMEQENKLNSSTRKSRSESTNASGRNSRKASPRKNPVKKEAVVSDKITKGNICDQKSSISPKPVNTEGRKDSVSLSSDNRSDVKEGTAARSRSRDLGNEEVTVSPTRVLRSKVKHTVPNDLANHIVDSEIDSKEAGSTPLEVTSDNKCKGTSKTLDNKQEPSSEKCDSTTIDTMGKYESTLPAAEDVENSLNRRKTRSSVKLTPKVIENSSQETCQSSNDNLLLPKLRSSVSRKLNGSPLTVTSEGVSVDSNLKQFTYNNSVEDDGSLSDTVSLKSEIVGDELKLTIKRIKKTVQSDKADISIASESNIVQKSIRETPGVDNISKDKIKTGKTSSIAELEVLSNQSTMLSAQDTAVCNAEAVSLKTPPMGSVVTPEPDNIQAVDDMPQQREPEGAKSSTRTAQLRSLVSLQSADCDGREHVSFHGDKGRVERKRLARERSILGKKSNQPILEDFKNKPQNSIVDSPLSEDIGKQPSHFGVHGSSRNSSPAKTPKSSIENPFGNGNASSDKEDAYCRRITRSSLSGATHSLVKSSLKDDFEKDCSKPKRGANSPNVGSSTLKPNYDTHESSGSKNKKVSKEADKQLGKRPQGEFESRQTIHDEVPVRPKLRKIETTPTVNFIESGIKSENSKIMASVPCKGLSNPDKKALLPKGGISKSIIEPETVEATCKVPGPNGSICRTDKVCVVKENTKKDIVAPKLSAPQDPVSKHDGSSKPDPLAETSPVMPHGCVKKSVKQQKSEKGPASRRKSKIAPPTKRVSSDVAVSLTEGKEKTSVKEVCLASESLDKILREEDIKEVPSSFDVLAQSPGKSPDSTTQSRVDIVISKLAQEPLIVNSRKISEDSQGVTSTTEIESVPIIVEKPPSPLVREKQSHNVGKGKKEDEGVSSTTVDSKLSVIPYSDTKYVDIKKKSEVKASPHSKQSANKTTVDSQQPLDEQTRKESLVPYEKSPVPPQSSDNDKMVPESPSKLLKRSDIQTIKGEKQPSSGLGGCGNDDTAPEYDVLHPRMKIWRVADLNKILNEENAVKVQASCRVNETSNHKTLSDEKLKRTPLKKRQVWGIQLDDKIVLGDEASRNEEKKTPEKSDNSPTSSVDQLPHSIYNILSVGPGDVTQTIQEADSRSGSKEGSRLSNLKRKGYIKYRKSLKKVRVRHSKKNHSITRSSCRWRRGLQRSRLLRTFPKRNKAIKVKRPSKKLKKIKPLRTTCNEPEIVEVVELFAQGTDLATQKTSDATEVVETVRIQPKLIQNEPVKPNLSKPSLLLGDAVPDVTIQSSLPAVHNYKELTVDLTEDEEASPQYSPLRPRDQDSVSQELPIPVHSNLSGGFTPVAPKWTKQSCPGGLIVPSSTNVGPFIVSPQATPVPRPIMERSRSFSSLGQTSKPRARRESHPALRHAVQSPTPVDLSFHSKKSRSDSSSSHRIVNPEGLVIPNNIGKIDLFGQNPTFSTSLHGDVVTFDLAQNQVVCMKPTSITCMNRPIETVPPMSDQLNTPIRPIPLSNHKDRPAPISAYPPLSGNNVKDLMPAANSSFNDFSRLYQQPLSAFHAMKNNNSSISHGTHIMLSPVDVSKMSPLCPSTSPSNGRMKSIHLKRSKGDVSCPTSSKVNFTNPMYHEDVRRGTDVRAIKMVSQQPLFNENESGRLPYCSSDAYKLGYMKNTNPPLLPSTLNTSVLPVARGRSYQTEKGRSDQSLIERHQQALQKVVREFNDGMNSIKDSNSFSNIQEATKPSLDRSSDNTSVKMVNFTKCSEPVPIPDVIPSFIVTAPKPIINAVDLSDQLRTDDNISKRVQCNATPPKQMKAPEEVHEQRLVGTPDIFEEAAKSEVASEPSVSKTTPHGNEPIKSPDNVLKRPKVSEGCAVASNESCSSSDPIQCVVSPPTPDSKAAGDQVAKDLPDIIEERVEDKSGEKRDVMVTEIEESSDNPSPATPVVSEEFKLDSQLINATLEGNETIKSDSAITETQVSNDEEHGSKPSKPAVSNLVNNLETKILVVMTNETVNDEMSATSEQPLPSPDTLTKSKIELPTESSELGLIPDHQICLNENPIEPVGSEISPSTTQSSLTPILQVLEPISKPISQLAPEKVDTCTDHSLPEVSCQDETSDSTINEADVKTTKPQPQEMERQVNSEKVSAISIDEESSVIPNSVQSSECKETLFDVSDKLPEIAGDNSVASDSTGGAIRNNSLVSLNPISNLNPTNPFESKVDNPIELNQSLEDSEESSEVSDHNLSTIQTACNVGEQDHGVSNAGLNPLSIVSDHLGTASSFDTPLPSPSPTNEVISELNMATETAVPSSANESLTPVTALDSKSSSNVLMCSNSDWNGDSPIRETESVNNGVTINVSTFPNARKRKLPPDSDDEDVHSIASIDSSTCLIEKCKKVEAKVEIRPISPTTVDQIGLKIHPADLQDIVRCWQEFNRSSERASQNQNVGRAESVARTTDVDGSQTLSNVNITEPGKATVRSGKFEDPISRPSTSRETGAQSPSPLNRYLLERELFRRSVLRRKSQKRTCVRETFARGIKIHQRDIGVKTSGVNAFTPSTRRPSSISDFVSAIPPIRPIDRSYSRILEYLRETRKTIETESIIIQSCKDFIKGVSKDAVPGCQVKTSNTSPVGTHSRVHNSDGSTPVTNRSPTTLGATTTVISSESEDSNGGDHVMKGRAEVRKRSRRKVSSFVKVCSCPSPSHNHSSNVCPTCGKARNRAQGASSPIHSSNAPLYTEVSNMQRRESERIMKCAAVGGGEENVIVPDSITVDLLKALASLAGRRPTSSVTPVTAYSPPCSLTCDDPVPSSRSEVFSLPYEKDLLSPRVTVVPDPPLHDASLPPPVPETTRGSSTRCSEQKLSYDEAPCLLEGNDVNLQQRRELVAQSQVASSSEILSSTSCRPLEMVDERDEPYHSPSACQSLSSDKSRVPLTQQTSSADNDTLSTPNSAEEATRLLSRIGKLITPDVLEEIQRLLPNMDLLRPSADPSEEPPLKKRKE